MAQYVYKVREECEVRLPGGRRFMAKPGQIVKSPVPIEFHGGRLEEQKAVSSTKMLGGPVTKKAEAKPAAKFTTSAAPAKADK